MKYTKIGKSDIEVSKLCIGCMGFGKLGVTHQWTLNETDTERVVKHALDAGINFFDTANVYSGGTSEEYLGKAIKNNIARDKVVIASKVYFNEGKLSKEAINREIDSTLKRLGTDYLDLYIIHRFDYSTPIEETMSALDGLIKQGKVRAIGRSEMYPRQFVQMQETAAKIGTTPFSVLENRYNLIYRENEKELIPYGKKTGMFFMPYSPLATGYLTRANWTGDTLRGKTDKGTQKAYDDMEEHDIKIVKRVAELAEKHNCKMSQIAIAWEWAKDMDSPIIGATKPSYIDDAVGAFDVRLDDDDINYLEELYVPHPLTGPLDK